MDEKRLVTVGNNLKRYRMDRGYTQAEFAKLLGIAQPTLSEVERGKKLMSFKKLASTADALGITIPELVMDVENEPVTQ